MRGPRGEIDVPGVRGIVTDLAPERGEMIVDMDALDMDARPVDDEDYVRPRDRRPKKQAKPKGPAQPPKGTGPVRKPVDPAASPCDPDGQGTPAARQGQTGAREGRADAARRRPSPEPVTPSPAPDASTRRRLMALEVDVLTLFPPMLEGPLGESIPARIQERGLATVRVHDLRGWGLGRHRTVDDYTYGGGAGMVLRPEVVAAALGELRRPDSTVILLDPAGRVFRQAVGPRAGGATAPRLPVPPLRGRGRADPRRWWTWSSRSATTC